MWDLRHMAWPLWVSGFPSIEWDCGSYSLFNTRWAWGSNDILSINALCKPTGTNISQVFCGQVASRGPYWWYMTQAASGRFPHLLPQPSLEIGGGLSLQERSLVSEQENEWDLGRRACRLCSAGSSQTNPVYILCKSNFGPVFQTDAKSYCYSRGNPFAYAPNLWDRCRECKSKHTPAPLVGLSVGLFV